MSKERIPLKVNALNEILKMNGLFDTFKIGINRLGFVGDLSITSYVYHVKSGRGENLETIREAEIDYTTNISTEDVQSFYEEVVVPKFDILLEAIKSDSLYSLINERIPQDFPGFELFSIERSPTTAVDILVKVKHKKTGILFEYDGLHGIIYNNGDYKETNKVLDARVYSNDPQRLYKESLFVELGKDRANLALFVNEEDLT